MAMKTPLFWEKDDDWHYAVCGSCLHNSHETVKMVRQKIWRTGNPDCAGGNENELDVWICPVYGFCMEL